MSDPATALLDHLPAPAGEPGDHQESAAWIANFLATCLDPGDRPQLAGLPAGDGHHLHLPLRWVRQRFGPFAPRLLASLTNVYSCRYQPLGLVPGQDPTPAFARWGRDLRQGRPRPDALSFDALDTATGEAIAAGLRQAGYWVEPVARFGNWYLPATGLGFDAYWADRPSRLRHTVERKERRLHRDHRVAIEVLAGADDADQAIAAWSTVDATSWKQPEPYPGFLPGLIRSGLATGRLEVGILTVDAVPAAAQLWLVAGGRATIFKLSYAEAFKSHSVGSILTRHLIRRGLDRGGLSEIDFGRGDDPYKQDWLPRRRQRWSLLAYDPLTPLGLLLGVRNLLPRQLRRLRAGGRRGGITTASDG